MIEDGLRSLLTSDANVSALIGTRFYPLNLPTQQVVPAVTYRVISTVEDYTLEGATGCMQMRLQVDSWGNTYGESRQVAAAIRHVLNAYSGMLPNGCEVLNITRDGEMTGFDEYALQFYTQTDWLVLYSD